jgi:hypothetical protein
MSNFCDLAIGPTENGQYSHSSDSTELIRPLWLECVRVQISYHTLGVEMTNGVLTRYKRNDFVHMARRNLLTISCLHPLLVKVC